MFIIHFTSPLFIVNHLKNNSLSHSVGEGWGGRFRDLYEFGLLSIRQPLFVGWSGGIRKEAV